LPHSEIHGSKLIRSSPRLIAAYHVLHRLCMPRHPPNALTTLNRSHCLCSSSSRHPEGTNGGQGYLLQPDPLDNAIDVFDRPALLEPRRAARLQSIIKTSFSRSNPRMRGQATSTRTAIRQGQALEQPPILEAPGFPGPDQSSLHNVGRTGIRPCGRCKLFFFQGYTCLRSRAEGAPLGRQTIGDAPCACEATLRHPTRHQAIWWS